MTLRLTGGLAQYFNREKLAHVTCSTVGKCRGIADLPIFLQISTNFVPFAERSQAVAILDEFRSNLFKFCAFCRAKPGDGDFG
jgi:hypothetical protein